MIHYLAGLAGTAVMLVVLFLTAEFLVGFLMNVLAVYFTHPPQE